MIIFDLDGTLADCEHRRHFVDPEKSEDTCFLYDHIDSDGCPLPGTEKNGEWTWDNGKDWKPDWKSFYEACDRDKPIEPVINILATIIDGQPGYPGPEIQIWSGRCESVREKTINWLKKNIICEVFSNDYWFQNNLKMRPIGDNTPDDQLKERWLDEAIAQGKTVEFVFDDRPKVRRMWRRRGIFVFNCQQGDHEF